MLSSQDIANLAKEKKTVDKFLDALEKMDFVEANYDDKLPSLAREVNRRREKLVWEAKSISDRVIRAAQETQREIFIRGDEEIFLSGGINSLGELQGSGSSFDICCALYCESFNSLVKEISQRAHQETESKLKEKFAELTRFPNLNVISFLREHGDSTVKQLTQGLGFAEAGVCDVLDELYKAKAVFAIGARGHYRLTKPFVEFLNKEFEPKGEKS